MNIRPSTPELPLAIRMLIATVLFGASLAIHILTQPITDSMPFMVFYPAMILCFVFCGMIPGIVMAAVSCLTGYYLFSPLILSVSHPAADELAAAIFVLSSVPLGLLVRNLTAGRRDLLALTGRQSAIIDTRLFGIAKCQDRHIRWCNTGFEEMLGYEPGELFDQSTLIIFPDDESYTAVGHAAYPLLRSGQRYHSETRIRRKDGRLIWIALNATMLDHPAGESLWMFDDITERKMADARLRTSEAFLTRTGAVAGVGGWQLDLRTDVLQWSATTCLLHDLPPGHQPTVEEAIGFFAPEVRPKIGAAVRMGMLNGTPWDLELPMISAAGRHFWGRAVGMPEYENGTLVRLIGALQDVTKKRQTERRLVESQELLTVTLESIGDGVITTDVAGHVTWLNPMAETMTGWARHQVGGRTLNDIFRVRDADTGEVLPTVTLETQGSYTPDRNAILTARDGTDYAVEKTISTIRGYEGATLGSVLVFRDVTEKRRLAAELIQHQADSLVTLRRLDTIFANSPDIMALVRVEPTGDYVFEAMNPSWEAMRGVSSAEAVGRGPRDILPAAAAEGIIRQLTICVEQRKTLPFSYKTPLGHWNSPDIAEIEGSITPVFGPIDRVTHLTIVGRDVTARNRLEASVHQMQRMDAVGQLTAGVAHDFNNMLQSIMASLELLSEQASLSSDALEYVAIAEGAAERGATLVHRLLAFSRKQPLEPVILKPKTVVENLAGLLSTTLGRRIKIETTIPANIWPVKADGGQLENCLLNLAINARDAMPAGGLLRLSATNNGPEAAAAVGLSPGEYVCFAVADNGAGIPPDILARVLEPFFTTKPIGVGNGLGLSMVQGFARQSGGDVRIDSVPEEGSTISLWLPRAKDAAGASGTVVEMEVETRSDLPCVVVVDDDPGIRRSLSTVLRSAGYDALTFETGDIAFERLKAGCRCDLLVTDQSMPGMSGGALIAHMARMRPRLPMMLITGFDKASGLEEVRDRAMILRKPFRNDTFLQRVSTLIGPSPKNVAAEAIRPWPRIAREG